MTTTFGTWRQLLHWGPLLALFVITVISTTTINCILMYWPPLLSIGGFMHMSVFMGWNLLTLSNFFLGLYDGPGFVKFGWKPADKNAERYLQYCKVCEGYKAPRSHHCRKCQRCVMKMDHHCPWINTCVGHRNHARFIYFLLFWLGYNNYRHLSLSRSQLKTVLYNKTGIETWICEKAEHFEDEKPFVFPYDLGWRGNAKLVLRWNGRPVGDGIWWPVRDGCNQYTLTAEQKYQKEEKRTRAVKYTIVESYGGALLPVSKGCRVLCGIPYSDEPRIRLETGDEVRVTRWKRHWMYGEQVTQPPMSVPPRGWFPRRCAVELINGDCDFPPPPKVVKKKQN
ncbi:PREDICTED: palmitoyltransferase ZDHHC6-like [Priapulus caudatus]|uniref:Palmitoyltransferase n=1 Tax=Priapulus caudatus TaxID=37621 RepID=A0ABM1EWY2_PRICU|nr:PREDICTED: palmitoyltransferase ZDHHC6-like [Priapulus caudatus]